MWTGQFSRGPDVSVFFSLETVFDLEFSAFSLVQFFLSVYDVHSALINARRLAGLTSRGTLGNAKCVAEIPGGENEEVGGGAKFTW